jgi:hypothetical protein
MEFNSHVRRITLWALSLAPAVILSGMLLVQPLTAQNAGSPDKEKDKATTANVDAMVPDPKQVGGEPEGIVQVANLVYAGVKSSHCFSDHFLITAEKESAISTSRRFHAVKLSSEEIFLLPAGDHDRRRGFSAWRRRAGEPASIPRPRRLFAGFGWLLVPRMGPGLSPRDGRPV